MIVFIDGITKDYQGLIPSHRREYKQWINGDANPALDVFEDKPNYYGSDVSSFFSFDERVRSAPIYTAPMPKFEFIRISFWITGL